MKLAYPVLFLPNYLSISSFCSSLSCSCKFLNSYRKSRTYVSSISWSWMSGKKLPFLVWSNNYSSATNLIDWSKFERCSRDSDFKFKLSSTYVFILLFIGFFKMIKTVTVNEQTMITKKVMTIPTTNYWWSIEAINSFSFCKDSLNPENLLFFSWLAITTSFSASLIRFC
jgi:hypothetical protein